MNRKTCTFKFNYNASMRMITFSCEVMGVGPKFADKYQVVTELLNAQGQVIEKRDSGVQDCRDDGLSKDIKHELVPNQNACAVRVTCLGKDIEYWAGNFGTRFRNESL